jgi:hypothetical protein
VSDFAKLEEVSFLCTIWNFVGPCSLQVGITSISSQDCSYSRFRTTYISHTTKGKSSSHRLLHEFYQRLWEDHNTHEKMLKKKVKFQWNKDC